MFDREIMGTPEAAKAALLKLTREWRDLRQPLVGSGAAQKRRELLDREVRFQLANAALLWLWHEENALTGERDAR